MLKFACFGFSFNMRPYSKGYGGVPLVSTGGLKNLTWALSLAGHIAVGGSISGLAMGRGLTPYARSSLSHLSTQLIIR